MMAEAESLHTAARRYCAERADAWRAKYGEIAKRNERPAKSGLLRRLGLTAPGTSDEGRTIYPRYNILDAILVEIESRTGAEFTSREDVTRWLIAASRAAYEEETRPPDLVFSNISDTFSPDFQERIRALGPKAKIVGGQGLVKDRAAQHRAMEEECDALATYLTRLTEDDLVLVAPLPHRRTLDDSESDRLWSLLGC